jgi:hypothetical protein
MFFISALLIGSMGQAIKFNKETKKKLEIEKYDFLSFRSSL